MYIELLPQEVTTNIVHPPSIHTAVSSWCSVRETYVVRELIMHRLNLSAFLRQHWKHFLQVVHIDHNMLVAATSDSRILSGVGMWYIYLSLGDCHSEYLQSLLHMHTVSKVQRITDHHETTPDSAAIYETVLQEQAKRPEVTVCTHNLLHIRLIH